MKKTEMIKGAKKLVEECTKVKKGENALIITDTVTPFSIAEVLAIACRERGAETMIVIMSPLSGVGDDPPPPVVEAMQKAQVVFVASSRGILHSPSRVRASKAGARFFNLSEIAEDRIRWYRLLGKLSIQSLMTKNTLCSLR